VPDHETSAQRPGFLGVVHVGGIVGVGGSENLEPPHHPRYGGGCGVHRGGGFRHDRGGSPHGVFVRGPGPEGLPLNTSGVSSTQ